MNEYENVADQCANILMINGLTRAVEIIEKEIEIAIEINPIMAMGMLQANKLLINEIKELSLKKNKDGGYYDKKRI